MLVGTKVCHLSWGLARGPVVAGHCSCRVRLRVFWVEEIASQKRVRPRGQTNGVESEYLSYSETHVEKPTSKHNVGKRTCDPSFEVGFEGLPRYGSRLGSQLEDDRI